MSAPPYMKLYWGDYHKDTRHLSRNEHGAYLLLIGEAWERGGSLPDDDVLLARWTLSTAKEWAEMRPTILAFFKTANGVLTHKRVCRELGHYNDVSRKRKSAGKAGGHASLGKPKGNRTANEQQLLSKSQAIAPITRTRTKDTSSRGSEPAADDLFSGAEPSKRAWALAVLVLTEQGGMKQVQARSFFGKLLADTGVKPQDLLEALEAARKVGTEDPRAYLVKAAHGGAKAQARHLAIVRSNIQ